MNILNYSKTKHFFMNQFLIALFILCSTVEGIAQQSKNQTLTLDSLNLLGQKILYGPDFESRKAAHDQFYNKIVDLLKQPTAYSIDFEPVKNLVKLVAPDNQFKLITWNLPTQADHYQYFAFVMINPEKTKETKLLFELKDKHEDAQKPENKTYRSATWYGCLYYKIIKTKDKKKEYYTLLGWDGHDSYTNKKVIDVLHFDQKGDVVFGAPLFEGLKRKQHRVIFEYSKEVSMSLNWNEQLDMIVFDHLSPPDDKLIDQYAFYGPDMSFDGFKWEKGKWKYYEKIDVKNNSKNGGNNLRPIERGLEKKQ